MHTLQFFQIGQSFSCYLPLGVIPNGSTCKSTILYMYILATGVIQSYAEQLSELEAWLSFCGDCHHGNAFQYLVTASPNLIKTLGHNYKPSLFLLPISVDK